MKDFTIIHEEVLEIDFSYQHVKNLIIARLNPWMNLFTFNDAKGDIIYKTEGPLVPEDNGRIPVLILLSNPHPHSVSQGMFLSPNRSGRPNPFWKTMEGTGYFLPQRAIGPSMMIKNEYESPFRFYMAVLLPFPSEYPDDLIEILGYGGYQQMLRNGIGKIESLIREHRIKNIICFTKLTYDALCRKGSAVGYTNILMSGCVIQSSSRSSDKVRFFLTFPTGWRYVKNAATIKTENLRRIFSLIIGS